MASFQPILIHPQQHYSSNMVLDTEERLKEAVEATQRQILAPPDDLVERRRPHITKVSGGAGVDSPAAAMEYVPCENVYYVWRVSETFNSACANNIVCTTCIRAEAIFLGYSYAIWTINNVHVELQNIISEYSVKKFYSSSGRGGSGSSGKKWKGFGSSVGDSNQRVHSAAYMKMHGGGSENAAADFEKTSAEAADIIKAAETENHFSQDKMKDLCNRLVSAYEILTDVVKINLLLWTQRDTGMASAELHVETCDALINITIALHTIAYIEYSKVIGDNGGKRLSRKVTSRLFLAIAIHFEKAYALLTRFTWVMYGGDSITAKQIQRSIVGYALYYRGKAYTMAALALNDSVVGKLTSFGSGGGSSKSAFFQDNDEIIDSNIIAMALFQTAYRLFSIVAKNPDFGFEERAETLRNTTNTHITNLFETVPSDSFVRRRVDSADSYYKMLLFIQRKYMPDSDALTMILTQNRVKGKAPFYKPNLAYGNYPVHEYHRYVPTPPSFYQ